MTPMTPPVPARKNISFGEKLSSLLGTTNDDTANLTKAERLAKVAQDIELLEAKQNMDITSSNKAAAAKANAEDVVSVSSASSDSSSESDDSSDVSSHNDDANDDQVPKDAASDSDLGRPAFRSTKT
jgi:hypothetical protein